MKNTAILLLAILCMSCQDFGTVTVTYTKATAKYGDLEALRATPLKGAVQPLADPGKIFIADDLLLIGEEGKGVHVFDNHDPKNPTARAFIAIPENREFFVRDNYLYAESIYDMVKIDIADPRNPQLVSRVPNALFETLMGGDGQALIGFDFEVVTKKVKVGSDESFYNEPTIHYYDYAHNLIPPSAVPTSFAGTSANGMGSVNRIAYANGHVFVVSRTQLSAYRDEPFEQVGKTYAWGNLETVFPFEDRLFVGAASSMQIFDVSNPAEPLHVSSYDHMESCDPVYPVNSSTAYLTLRTGDFATCPGEVNQLLVLDVTGTWATELQMIEMKSPFGLSLIGNQLFVGEGENGLKIFDATDRRHLDITTWDRSIEAYDIMAHPTNPGLVLIAGPDGFSQYRIDQNNEFEYLSTVTF